VDPITGVNIVEKRKFLTPPGFELRPSVVQPIASRYTDCAIPAVRRVKSFNDRMSSKVLRNRWCDTIVPNVHAPAVDETDKRPASVRN
jgi:hypothetical protein